MTEYFRPQLIPITSSITPSTLLNYAPSTVLNRFADSETFANSAYATTVAALNALRDIALALELISRTIPIDTTSISIPEISISPPTIDPDEFTVDMPILPTEPVIVDASIGTLPEFPDLVVGDLQMPDETYATSLLTAIKSKLLSDVNTGSTGLTPAIEDAIFQREYERALIIHNDTQDRIAATWARNGYPLPNGALLGAYEEEEINFTNKRLDMSRDTAIKSFELALQNYHFIIQQGIALESQLMGYAHSVATLAFQVADEIIKNALVAFRERREAVSAKIASILETAKTKIQYNISLIEMYTAKLSAYSAKIRGETDRVNAVARGYEAEVAEFRSVADFEISKAGLDLKVIDAKISQAVANANILIKDKEIEMKNYELLNSLKEKAMEAISHVAAQITASALTMVHASASIGSDIHYGFQNSASQSVSASEQASFEYKYDMTE